MMFIKSLIYHIYDEAVLGVLKLIGTRTALCILAIACLLA